MKAVGKELGLCINASKTKVMVIGQVGCLPESNVLKEYEKVDTFASFGSTIEVNYGSLAEIQFRITLGKLAMTRLREYHVSFCTQQNNGL